MMDVPEEIQVFVGGGAKREKIRGAVAQILNARELVINRGTTHGVLVGMQFAVLNPLGQDIVDPETGEHLGSIEVPKVFVKVVRVAENLSIASTFRTYMTGSRGSLSAWAALLPNSEPPRKQVETLRTDSPTVKEDLDPKDSYVHVGDPVIQAREDEYEGWEE